MNHTLFGFPLKNFSKRNQILLLTIVVFIFEISYGIVQEILFSVDKFPYEWFGTLVQFVLYTIMSLLHHLTLTTGQNHKSSKKGIKGNATKTPYTLYTVIAFVSLVSRGTGNAAFKHLDYSLKVLFTSAKPVLVMIAGIFLLGKHYSWAEYLSTLLMVLGLSGFSVADAQGSGLFSILGLILILGSLFTDALKSAFQESAMKGYKCSEVDVSLWSSVVGTVMTFAVVLYTDQLWPGFQYCMKHPSSWVLMVILFTVGYISSIAVLSLIIISDAFTSSIITTVRKAVTVFLSYIAFQKHMSLQHAFSVFIFFGGIIFHSLRSKNKKKS